MILRIAAPYRTKMIDLHNHILPGIDDGARTLDESLQMATQAVEIGTTVMAVTPHRFWPGRDAPAAWLTWNRMTLQRELDKAGIPLRLVDGTEIPMGPHIADLLATNRLSRLGGSTGTHALIEPPFDRIPRHALSILKEIIAQGIMPILAHPERNVEVQGNAAFIEACAAIGVVLQVTSGSIMGKFGASAELTARKIVCRDDWEVIIASDAHWSEERTPSLLKRAADRVVEWTGDPSRAIRMVTGLPASYLPSPPPPDPTDLPVEPPDSAHA